MRSDGNTCCWMGILRTVGRLAIKFAPPPQTCRRCVCTTPLVQHLNCGCLPTPLSIHRPTAFLRAGVSRPRGVGKPRIGFRMTSSPPFCSTRRPPSEEGHGVVHRLYGAAKNMPWKHPRIVPASPPRAGSASCSTADERTVAAALNRSGSRTSARCRADARRVEGKDSRLL